MSPVKKPRSSGWSTRSQPVQYWLSWSTLQLVLAGNMSIGQMAASDGRRLEILWLRLYPLKEPLCDRHHPGLAAQPFYDRSTAILGQSNCYRFYFHTAHQGFSSRLWLIPFSTVRSRSSMGRWLSLLQTWPTFALSGNHLDCSRMCLQVRVCNNSLLKALSGHRLLLAWALFFFPFNPSCSESFELVHIEMGSYFRLFLVTVSI